MQKNIEELNKVIELFSPSERDNILWTSRFRTRTVISSFKFHAAPVSESWIEESFFRLAELTPEITELKSQPFTAIIKDGISSRSYTPDSLVKVRDKWTVVECKPFIKEINSDFSISTQQIASFFRDYALPFVVIDELDVLRPVLRKNVALLWQCRRPPELAARIRPLLDRIPDGDTVAVHALMEGGFTRFEIAHAICKGELFLDMNLQFLDSKVSRSRFRNTSDALSKLLYPPQRCATIAMYGEEFIQ